MHPHPRHPHTNASLPFFLIDEMGRRTCSKEHRVAKKKEWNQKYVTNPESLAKKQREIVSRGENDIISTRN